MDTASKGYFCWLIVISLAVFYNFVVIIPRAVFKPFQRDNWHVWLGFDILSDVIYILDVLVGLNTGYLEQGLLVTNWKATAKHFISSIYFKLDLLSIAPLEIFYLVPPINPHRTYVRLNRFARVYRTRQLLDRTESSSGHLTMVRISNVVISVLVIIHWNACAYALMCQLIGIGNDTWVFNKSDGIDNYGEDSYNFREQWLLYVYSFFWAMMTLSACADPPPPITNGELVFVIVNYLLGVLVFASIVGSFASIIANANRSRDAFQQRVDGVKQYLRFRRVGSEWEKRIIAYFDYILSTNQCGKERSVLSVLPDALRAEIALAVHGDSLRRVKLFEDCEPGLLEKLVVNLRQAVYSPGQFVCCEGEVGKEMYIVKVGQLDVIAGKALVATLTEGGFFGELSLLDVSRTPGGNRRRASVVSRGYSELFVLTKQDLWASLEEFPETKKRLVAAGRERLNCEEKLEAWREETSAVPPRLAAGRDKYSIVIQRIDALEASVECLEKALSLLLEKYKYTQARLKQEIYELEKLSAFRPS